MGSSVTVGGLVSTTKVTGALHPDALPIALGWVAIAVNVPSPRAGAAALEVQLPLPPGAWAVATISPSGLGPSKTSTVTSVVSLAVPENAGLSSLDGEGEGSSVTVGGLVSTTKVTGALHPDALPIALGWVAIAVNVPSPRAGAAALEVQLPPMGAARAVATMRP